MVTRLPERFVLTIEGKLWNVHRRAVIAPNSLPHLLAEMLAGRECPTEVFEAFGLRVTIEQGTDQGDDGPDTLSVRR